MRNLFNAITTDEDEQNNEGREDLPGNSSARGTGRKPGRGARKQGHHSQPVHPPAHPRKTQSTAKLGNGKPATNACLPPIKTTYSKQPTVDLAKTVALVAAAQKSQKAHVYDAILAGQKLLEDRQVLSLRHDGATPTEAWENDKTFKEWIGEKIVVISWRTAQRWMQAANRVMCIVLEHHHSDPPLTVAMDGRVLPISDVLTAPESESTEAMRTFQETFKTFLGDRTLIEVAASVVDGESEGSHITRAANGKLKGGRGGNRRAYAQFVACHFKQISNILKKWDALQRKDPGEYAKMTEAIRRTVLGGPVKIKDRGRPVDMTPWPKSFTELIVSIGKERLGKGFPRPAPRDSFEPPSEADSEKYGEGLVTYR
jgi:hypothetical protein